MADTGPLSAALEEIRGRHHPVPDTGAGRFRPDGSTEMPSICASDRHRWPCHAHVLGDAVAGVLEVHSPDRIAPDWCAACGFNWPCSGIQVIARALLGEEAWR